MSGYSNLVVAGWLDESIKEREAVIYMTGLARKVALAGEELGEAVALSQLKYCITQFN